MEVIEKVHACDKPLRIRSVPEGITVYYTFWNMGIDYINTDFPEQCAAFYGHSMERDSSDMITVCLLTTPLIWYAAAESASSPTATIVAIWRRNSRSSARWIRSMPMTNA